MWVRVRFRVTARDGVRMRVRVGVGVGVRVWVRVSVMWRAGGRVGTLCGC